MISISAHPNPISWAGSAGLIFSALLVGSQPLTWPDSSAETAYKELITHTPGDVQHPIRSTNMASDLNSE